LKSDTYFWFLSEKPDMAWTTVLSHM